MTYSAAASYQTRKPDWCEPNFDIRQLTLDIKYVEQSPNYPPTLLTFGLIIRNANKIRADWLPQDCGGITRVAPLLSQRLLDVY